MKNCKRASQLISQSLDRRLTLRERLVLRWHLLICDNCTRFNALLQRLQVAVRQLAANIENDTSISLPSAAKAKINEVIKRLQN